LSVRDLGSDVDSDLTLRFHLVSCRRNCRLTITFRGKRQLKTYFLSNILTHKPN